MEIHGNKLFLTIHEQFYSDYLSPIDMDEFDLHKERSEADKAIDRISSLQASDDVTEGSYISELNRAQMQSRIARTIGRELATRTAVVSMLNGIDNELSW